MYRPMIAFRVLFLLNVGCVISSGCFSQRLREVTAARTQFLKFDDAMYEGHDKIPFNNIKVLDFRFDTSKVGYVVRGRVHDKLTVKGGVQDGLGRYLNKYYQRILDPASPATLVIVVKKLWLQYDAVDHMLKGKDLDMAYNFEIKTSNTVCLADMETFVASENSYKALVKVNDSFAPEMGNKKNNLPLILVAFDSLVRIIGSMNVESALSQKKSFTLNDLQTAYQNRFSIPVLAVNELARGIYLTFQDFKNNKVSYPNFKYKRGPWYYVEITASENENDALTTDYWGFFDGKDLFVKPGHFPFKVIRQGNTFDMFGRLRPQEFVKPISIPTNQGVISPGYSGTEVHIYPLQVDMETGKVY